MKQSNSTNHFENTKIRESVITKMLRPLSTYLIDSENYDCEKIRDFLYFFKAFPISEVADNHSTICYSNLVEMHRSIKTPSNVFWVSHVDLLKTYPHEFLETFKCITDKILEKGFNVRHYLTFQEDNHISLFRYFEKTENEVHVFTGFYLVISNYETYMMNDEKFKDLFDDKFKNLLEL
jgi:hypothetical protein